MWRGARAAVGSTPGPGQGPGGTFPVNGERRPRASIQSGRETMLGPRVVPYSLPLSPREGEGKEESGPLLPRRCPSLSLSLFPFTFQPPSLPSRPRASPSSSFSSLDRRTESCLSSSWFPVCLYLLIIFYFVIVIIVIIIIRWLLWASKFDDVLSTDIAFRILRLTNTLTHTHIHACFICINFLRDC